jgi:hypothetical protein
MVVFLEGHMSSASLLREIEDAPEEIRQEVFDFLSFLKARRTSLSVATSEPQPIDWSDLASRWQRIWGNEFAPGSSVEVIVSDLRGES